MTAAWPTLSLASFDAGDALYGTRRAVRRLLRQPFHADYRLLARLRPAPGQVFVDAGAFNGDALDAMRLYHPGTPIHAFEPNPRRALRLADAFVDDPALMIYRCGLSDAEASAVLAAPMRAGRLVDEEASFDARRVERWEAVRWLETRLFALDDLELDVSLLKITVNGLERSVLEGARETLKRCEPLVLCSRDEAADAFMRERLGWARLGRDGRVLDSRRAGGRHALYAGPRMQASLARAGAPA